MKWQVDTWRVGSAALQVFFTFHILLFFHHIINNVILLFEIFISLVSFTTSLVVCSLGTLYQI